MKTRRVDIKARRGSCVSSASTERRSLMRLAFFKRFSVREPLNSSRGFSPLLRETLAQVSQDSSAAGRVRTLSRWTKTPPPPPRRLGRSCPRVSCPPTDSSADAADGGNPPDGEASMGAPLSFSSHLPPWFNPPTCSPAQEPPRLQPFSHFLTSVGEKTQSSASI